MRPVRSDLMMLPVGEGSVCVDIGGQRSARRPQLARGVLLTAHRQPSRGCYKCIRCESVWVSHQTPLSIMSHGARLLNSSKFAEFYESVGLALLMPPFPLINSYQNVLSGNRIFTSYNFSKFLRKRRNSWLNTQQIHPIIYI